MTFVQKKSKIFYCFYIFFLNFYSVIFFVEGTTVILLIQGKFLSVFIIDFNFFMFNSLYTHKGKVFDKDWASLIFKS